MNESLGSEALLDWWKARAQARRDTLARLLSRKPVNARQAFRRQMFVQAALQSVTNRKDWSAAIDEHLSRIEDALNAGKTTEAARNTAADTTESAETDE
jgi:hypothetical protein